MLEDPTGQSGQEAYSRHATYVQFFLDGRERVEGRRDQAGTELGGGRYQAGWSETATGREETRVYHHSPGQLMCGPDNRRPSTAGGGADCYHTGQLVLAPLSNKYPHPMAHALTISPHLSPVLILHHG